MFDDEKNQQKLLRISLICAFRIFSRFRTAFDGRRSTQVWLQNLAPFQVFINTSVIQDKTLTIYINFGKFKLEKAPNFVTRPASNVDRRTPFGSENKIRNAHISEMRSKWEDNQRIQTRLSRHKSLKSTLYLSLFIGYGVFLILQQKVLQLFNPSFTTVAVFRRE